MVLDLVHLAIIGSLAGVVRLWRTAIAGGVVRAIASGFSRWLDCLDRL